MSEKNGKCRGNSIHCYRSLVNRERGEEGRAEAVEKSRTADEMGKRSHLHGEDACAGRGRTVVPTTEQV